VNAITGIHTVYEESARIRSSELVKVPAAALVSAHATVALPTNLGPQPALST
jgi:hypothetical protein